MGLPLRAPRRRLLQGSGHDRGQPGRTVLEKVIRCPLLNALGGRLVTHGPAQDHEGNVFPQPSKDLEGLHGRPVTEVVIADDNLRVGLLEVLFEQIRRSGGHELQAITCLFKHPHRQFHIPRVVLYKHHPQRLRG